jgi:hypothetical protein
MFFAASLLSCAALLATIAFAAPSPGLQSHIQRRRQGAHLSGLMRPAVGVNNLPVKVGNSSHVAFSSNWTGAAFESPAGTYKSVTGGLLH